MEDCQRIVCLCEGGLDVVQVIVVVCTVDEPTPSMFLCDEIDRVVGDGMRGVADDCRVCQKEQKKGGKGGENGKTIPGSVGEKMWGEGQACHPKDTGGRGMRRDARV